MKSVYTGLYEDKAEQMETNLEVLQNLLDAHKKGRANANKCATLDSVNAQLDSLISYLIAQVGEENLV